MSVNLSPNSLLQEIQREINKKLMRIDEIKSGAVNPTGLSGRQLTIADETNRGILEEIEKLRLGEFGQKGLDALESEKRILESEIQFRANQLIQGGNTDIIQSTRPGKEVDFNLPQLPSLNLEGSDFGKIIKDNPLVLGLAALLLIS